MTRWTLGVMRLHFGPETSLLDSAIGEDCAGGRSCLGVDISRIPKRAGSRSQSDIERNNLIAAVFEQLPCALLIVDANRNLIAANRMGEKLLASQSSGLVVQSRQLKTTATGQAALLRRLVASACSCASDTTARTMLLSDPAGRATFSLSISALAPSSDFRNGAGQAVILMKAISLGLPSSFSDRLRSLFGLSAKEARLATMLAEGCALKEAAGLLGVRFATARSYLENIFQKTFVNHQGKLVALLRSVQPLE